MQYKNRNRFFSKLGIDFKGIHRVLCRIVELESVSNTSKKLLRFEENAEDGEDEKKEI